ncbi:conserved protein of unknown function [Methylorubrum extorquens]|uniref:Uncharacterized protein n=1 Tax=Methylorubrum extorquens TaxID=408 RepID=A0A2N9ANI8_METEX|nr:conserved protein of unknown function [Methylorubrum extorquens]
MGWPQARPIGPRRGLPGGAPDRQRQPRARHDFYPNETAACFPLECGEGMTPAPYTPASAASSRMPGPLAD